MYIDTMDFRGFRVPVRGEFACCAHAGGELFPYPYMGGAGDIDPHGLEGLVHRDAGQYQSDDY